VFVTNVNKTRKEMKTLMKFAAVAALAGAIVGCKSTNVDEWRSDLKTQLCPAKFKPVYQVMKEKGIVSGESESVYTWWIWYTKSPDTFANEIGGPIRLNLKPGEAEAAFYDACNKAGATILLAPRFTVHKETGWFWFNGRTKVTVEGVPAKLVGAEEVKHPETPAPCGVCGANVGGAGCCCAK
jgi:hypothetical protein